MTSAPKTPAARPGSRRKVNAPVVTPQDPLRDRLLATVDLLKRRRAAEIGEDTIEAYINLHWMEWHGGSLRLTTTGENVCKHLASLLSRASPQPAN